MERPSDDASPRDSLNYATWMNVVLGLCVFSLHWASPRGTFDIRRNLFFTGLVIIFAALATAISRRGDSKRTYWSLINVATGSWLALSRQIFVPIPGVSVAQLALGIAVAVVAIVSFITDMS